MAPTPPGMDSPCEVLYDDLERRKPKDYTLPDTAFLNGELFSGCSYSMADPGEGVMFTFYESGLVTEQIAYYENGQMERRFTFVGGLSEGTHEMFYPDGSHYIRENYRHGMAHGKFERWYGNGQLAREAVFLKDGLLWDKYYDEEGVLIDSYPK